MTRLLFALLVALLLGACASFPCGGARDGPGADGLTAQAIVDRSAATSTLQPTAAGIR
jgi:hypothetical protein